MSNVTIIISNYNYGEFVLDAINSAVDQTYKCNIVVVDDGSTDNSVEKIMSMGDPIDSCISMVKHDYYSGPMSIIEFKNNIKLVKINNSGASTARNVGIWESWKHTDVFGILDADDMYKPTKVEILLKKLQEFNEMGVAYADYDIIRPKYTKVEYKQPYNKIALEKNCIVHSGALIKKEYLEKVLLPNKEIYDSKLHGPGSKKFIGCTEDYDLWLRLSNVCMFCHVPIPLSIVAELGHNQSLKMTTDIFNRNMQIIQQR